MTALFDILLLLAIAVAIPGVINRTRARRAERNGFRLQ